MREELLERYLNKTIDELLSDTLTLSKNLKDKRISKQEYNKTYV